jgi:hypothetical protein
MIASGRASYPLETVSPIVAAPIINQPDWFTHLTPGPKIELAVKPGINEYNGYRNVELEIKDCRPS